MAEGLVGEDRDGAPGGEDRRRDRPIRRLDHVAIAVEDTAVALAYFADRLGLAVVHTDELVELSVRLTYLDVGNAFIQLVEPTSEDSPIAAFLSENGEGVHHVCFGVDDVAEAVASLSQPGYEAIPLGKGRGRPSGFVANGDRHGVRVECTEFSFAEDVEEVRGWLPPEGEGR